MAGLWAVLDPNRADTLDAVSLLLVRRITTLGLGGLGSGTSMRGADRDKPSIPYLDKIIWLEFQGDSIGMIIRTMAFSHDGHLFLLQRNYLNPRDLEKEE